MAETPQSVLDYWFKTLSPKDWYAKDDEVDAEINRRFRDLHLAVSANITPKWHADANSRLALIILFDQMPRNMFRGSPHSFATDGLALAESRFVVATGLDREIDTARRAFLYMPFEHSERIEDQKRCVELFTALGNENYLSFANKHLEIIETYGRFPHRNAILGRDNTPEEEEYLAQPGAGF